MNMPMAEVRGRVLAQADAWPLGINDHQSATSADDARHLFARLAHLAINKGSLPAGVAQRQRRTANARFLSVVEEELGLT